MLMLKATTSEPASRNGPMIVDPRRSTNARDLVAIAGIAFLTLVDLFAAQAILPTLAQRYAVSANAIGLAVNASTLGMAIASLLVAIVARKVARRASVGISLLILSVPTVLLAHAPDVLTFAVLRAAQGLAMATAFVLTLAYLGERIEAMSAVAASAAYVTGNVASNLLGRLIAAGAVDHLGVAWSFYVFAALNVLGAMLAFLALAPGDVQPSPPSRRLRLGWDTRLAAACGIGFGILFAFIGTFTYVNFVLMRPPFGLNQMQVGLVYFVFLPSLVTTPLAGPLASRLGVAAALPSVLGLAGVGLPLLLLDRLPAVLTGLVLVAIGTFLAQAIMTGLVGRITVADRAAASGFYLASYFIGGLAGAAVLGRLFDRFGWPAAVLGIAVALAGAALLAVVLARLQARHVAAHPY